MATTPDYNDCAFAILLPFIGVFPGGAMAPPLFKDVQRIFLLLIIYIRVMNSHKICLFRLFEMISILFINKNTSKSSLLFYWNKSRDSLHMVAIIMAKQLQSSLDSFLPKAKRRAEEFIDLRLV